MRFGLSPLNPNFVSAPTLFLLGLTSSCCSFGVVAIGGAVDSASLFAKCLGGDLGPNNVSAFFSTASFTGVLRPGELSLLVASPRLFLSFMTCALGLLIGLETGGELSCEKLFSLLFITNCGRTAVVVLKMNVQRVSCMSVCSK